MMYHESTKLGVRTISDILGEMNILYIYLKKKALNELFLLPKVLSSMSVQFFINYLNPFTKSDQTMLMFCFGSPVKLVKCHLCLSGSTKGKLQSYMF